MEITPAAKAAIAKWKFDHVGAVVKDVNKTMELLAPLGIGPFKTHTHGLLIDNRYLGKPYNAKAEVVVVEDNIGGEVEFELIQPLEGDSPQQLFLDAHGESLHHLGFCVENLAEEVDRLTRGGAKLLWIAKRANGRGGAAYLELASSIFVELSQR